MIRLIALASILVGVAACERPAQSSADQTTAPSSQPELFTKTRPESPPNLVDVKAQAMPGDEVTFLARVGGKRVTFVDGAGVFVVADPSLVSCELMGEEDHCPIPWDYCCEDNAAIRDGLATIRLLGPSGTVQQQSAEGQGGLETLKYVVVTGTVQDRNDDGLFVVDASEIWVGGKPSRADRTGGSN